MKLPTFAGASHFAHLAGLARPKSSKAGAEDDEKERDAAAEGDDPESDDEQEKDTSAEGDDPEKDDDETKGKKGKRAAEDDDESEDDDPEKDDEKEEMTGKSAAARARRRERARCETILLNPAAVRNPQLASSLAFDTELTRKQAIKVLRATPATAATGRSDRNPRLGPGSDTSPNNPQAIQTSWDRAHAKVAGPARPAR